MIWAPYFERNAIISNTCVVRDAYICADVAIIEDYCYARCLPVSRAAPHYRCSQLGALHGGLLASMTNVNMKSRGALRPLPPSTAHTRTHTRVHTTHVCTDLPSEFSKRTLQRLAVLTTISSRLRRTRHSKYATHSSCPRKWSRAPTQTCAAASSIGSNTAAFSRTTGAERCRARYPAHVSGMSEATWRFPSGAFLGLPMKCGALCSRKRHIGRVRRSGKGKEEGQKSKKNMARLIRPGPNKISAHGMR